MACPLSAAVSPSGRWAWRSEQSSKHPGSCRTWEGGGGRATPPGSAWSVLPWLLYPSRKPEQGAKEGGGPGLSDMWPGAGSGQAVVQCPSPGLKSVRSWVTPVAFEAFLPRPSPSLSRPPRAWGVCSTQPGLGKRWCWPRSLPWAWCLAVSAVTRGAGSRGLSSPPSVLSQHCSPAPRPPGCQPSGRAWVWFLSGSPGQAHSRQLT